MKLFVFVLVNTLLLAMFFQKDLKFANSADFSGDIVDYQSVAVNHNKGYSFMHRGGLSEFENYKFSIDKTNPSTWDIENFYELTGIEFNRNPSYPFFLSTIYSFFGINPSIVKWIQLILLCFTSSLLIVVGNIVHGHKGLLIGLISSWIFCGSTYLFADMIFSECLIAFIMLLSLLVFLYHSKQRSFKSSLLLGLILGIGLISKGIFYFLILTILFFELYALLKKKNFTYLKQTFFWVITLCMTITPYLFWQNQQAQEFVAFVDNGDYVLLTSNNKYAIDGDWHPEGYDNNVYNGEELSVTYSQAVVAYYLSNPKIIIPSFTNKLSRAYLIPLIGRTFVFVCLLTFLLKTFSFKGKGITACFLILLFSIGVLFFNPILIEKAISYNYGQLIITLVCMLLVVKQLFSSPSIKILLPFVFAAILVTLCFHGRFRIVLPFMSIFSYLAIFYTFEVLLLSVLPNKHA